MKRILLIAGLMMLWVTAHSQIAYYKTGWKLADQEKVHVYSTNNGSIEFEIADGGEYRIRGRHKESYLVAIKIRSRE